MGHRAEGPEGWLGKWLAWLDKLAKVLAPTGPWALGLPAWSTQNGRTGKGPTTASIILFHVGYCYSQLTRKRPCPAFALACLLVA